MENKTLTGSNAEANSVYWDNAPATFYEKLISLPNVIQLYEQVTQTILSRVKFDPETTVLMDFACGPGALSAALAPHCKSIVGVDISQGMANAYNKRMEGLGITKARALRAELHPDEPQLTGEKFDAILCAQSYHHIEDNAAITRVLKSFLKPNGVLLVVDMMHGKDSIQVLVDMKSLFAQSMTSMPHPPNMMSHTGGYAEKDMKDMFEGAGLVEFTFEEAFLKEEDGKSLGLFLAKGVCPT